MVPFQASVTILRSSRNEPTDSASCLQHEGYGRRSGLERRVGENVLPKSSLLDRPLFINFGQPDVPHPVWKIVQDSSTQDEDCRFHVTLKVLSCGPPLLPFPLYKPNFLMYVLTEVELTSSFGPLFLRDRLREAYCHALFPHGPSTRALP